VTVVTTTCGPGVELIHSLRSILARSWTTLDIIVFDDASGPEADPVLTQALAVDDRGRLIRLDRNGGTYAARNVGIAAARGTIVTGQDDDEWPHPQWIERQVMPLIEAPDLPSTRARMFRATPRLAFHRLGSAPERVAPISLTFRREVPPTLGGVRSCAAVGRPGVRRTDRGSDGCAVVDDARTGAARPAQRHGVAVRWRLPRGMAPPGSGRDAQLVASLALRDQGGCLARPGLAAAEPASSSCLPDRATGNARARPRIPGRLERGRRRQPRRTRCRAQSDRRGQQDRPRPGRQPAADPARAA
jgi:hypothetical protein